MGLHSRSPSPRKVSAMAVTQSCVGHGRFGMVCSLIVVPSGCIGTRRAQQ